MKKLALMLTLVAASVMAETSTEVTGGTSIVTATVPSEAKITGSVEVRPSWTTNSGEFHTENTLTAGYQFNKNTDIGYNQYIDSNLYNPSATGGANGAGVVVGDGFFNSNLKNLYNNGNGLSLSYEPRLYLPTKTSKREAGMITTIRNNITLRQSFSPLFALSFVAIPMVHAYSQAGHTAGGKDEANPVFEQRFYLVGEFQFTDKISMAVPLMLESVRHANFRAGAAKNNSWTHKLYAWPEMYYAVDSNYMVGVAYMTGDLASATLSNFNLGSALANGVPQVILRAAL